MPPTGVVSVSAVFNDFISTENCLSNEPNFGEYLLKDTYMMTIFSINLGCEDTISFLFLPSCFIIMCKLFVVRKSLADFLDLLPVFYLVKRYVTCFTESFFISFFRRCNFFSILRVV